MMLYAFLIVLIAVPVIILAVISLLRWRAQGPYWRMLDEAIAHGTTEEAPSRLALFHRLHGAFGWLSWDLVARIVVACFVILLLFVVVSPLISGCQWMAAQIDSARQRLLEEQERVVEQRAEVTAKTVADEAAKDTHGVIIDWLDVHLPPVTADSEWQRLAMERCAFEGTWKAEEIGYYPLPVNLALASGSVRLRNPDFPQYSFSAAVFDQHYTENTTFMGDDRLLRLVHSNTATITSGLGALFVGLTRNNSRREIPLELELMVDPADDSILRVGRYREFIPDDEQATDMSVFGFLPFIIDEKKIDWTVHLSFIPVSERSESGLLPEPAVSGDYYLANYHEVVLVTADKTACYGPERIRDDSFELSSRDVREAWSENEDFPDSAKLAIRVSDPFLVHVVVRFE